MSQEEQDLYRTRHSLAHVLAQAVLGLRPGSRLGFGPPIEDGFYYDFILSEPLSDEDFPEIEKRMKRIIKLGQPFEMEELDADSALAKIGDMGEPYKAEYARDLIKKNGLSSLTFYTNGPFTDMCEGPHVENTRKIPPGCFKIRSLAGAYWRGDSNNEMMTRIYVWAFPDQKQLETHVRAYKDAQAHDHKKLGKELNLFRIDNRVGRGLPLWLPNGTVIRTELEKYITELEFHDGFERVATPHITKTDLYYKTGHLPYYAEGMYPSMELKEKSADGEEEIKESYSLRPMNCPHHHMIYDSLPRSYKELPIRFAEYGQVYRYEDSGALSGLLRVRGMCMNDAHIYCTEEQIKDEFLAVMRMHEVLYKTLGIENYYMRLSCWDPDDPKGKEKYVDNPEAWDRTQNILRDAMKDSGLPFTEVKGEAAFYGPKIDFQFRTVTGREESASTNQLDFAVPERVGLTYVDSDNQEKTPYCIHRAPGGTHERFVAFLIEHFEGAFPTWLAPVQVRVVTVSDQFNDFGNKIVQDLRASFVRAEMDKGSETMGKKIRLAAKAKIPNTLIVGEKEVQDGTVTLRRLGIKEQETMPIAAFNDWVLEKIKTRALN